MAMGITVSVIVPYYKQERYIRETVLSALNQEGAQIEVIIIDDGSPGPAASSLSDVEGIRLIRTENRGCAAARNFGFAHSTGEYLIFLDGDDVLLPGAVKAHLEALGTNPKAALSFGAFRVIDEHGRELRPPRVCRRRKNFLRIMFGTNPMPTPGTAMVRREAFEESGGFIGDFAGQVDDYHLYLQLLRRRPFVRHTFCVLNYRQHGSNVSRDQARMLRGVLDVLDRYASSNSLSTTERRRLEYGRDCWRHIYSCSAEPTLRFRLQDYYLKARMVMLTAPPTAWFE